MSLLFNVTKNVCFFMFSISRYVFAIYNNIVYKIVLDNNKITIVNAMDNDIIKIFKLMLLKKIWNNY